MLVTVVSILISVLSVASVPTTNAVDAATASTRWQYFSNSQIASDVETVPAQTEQNTYQKWLEERGSLYEKDIFLAKTRVTTEQQQQQQQQDVPVEGAAIFWTIHSEGTDTPSAISSTRISSSNQPWIQFAIAVPATGWVALGLSAAGGMLGSDMAIYDPDTDSDSIIDAYVVESRFPEIDDCQNWELLNVVTTTSTTSLNNDQSGWIILEIARQLDTNDPQDIPILDDSNALSPGARLIAAWGDGPYGYHGDNVVRSHVRLFADTRADIMNDNDAYHQKMAAMADGSFEVRADRYTIPPQGTTYEEFCFSYSELRALTGTNMFQSITLIGAGPIIAPEETAPFVHHFVVHGSEESNICSTNGAVLTAWAPGEPGLDLPDNVGIPVFGVSEVQSITLQIHYNNPERIPNQQDSSGVRFYFSYEPREMDAAYLQVGDPLLQLSGTTIGEGLSEWTFECDSACSTFALQGDSVTVISESLHMHQNGARMVNDLMRNGKVAHTSLIDVFEFNQQGSYRVPMQPYEIQSGDTFKTSCYYRDANKFGLSSEDEMCISFILYYPAKRLTFNLPWTCVYGLPFPVCVETLTSRTGISETDLGRSFGLPASSSQLCASPSNSYSEEEGLFPIDNTGEDNSLGGFNGNGVDSGENVENESSANGSKFLSWKGLFMATWMAMALPLLKL